ncbi:5-methyltetrahydropteroyltriglutamate--homocysteine S-methyltransferase [Agitococcus lubricus]|uniref:5-methyltetrahydropteroyltriglutamate--homocysteine methyltransferase n=1 Tax=Agitococcus lubricus TaxID=1077255 RepID=A0A2T5J182_9GAMM|nr:5-methyltetrahydropteroyltriglutamate--homocysteine S-methyltransferase [Agitococcus lubricus]PTQ90142.1 methionine synthase (B12-independent) [Agitococcus lubricus]
MRAHCLGFPRIGAQRELKKALEAYWSGQISQQELERVGQTLRQQHWQLQADAGLDWVTVGDFAFYDHVLNHSLYFGVIPQRFQTNETTTDLDLSFRLARGRAPTGQDAPACEMTKWFDTNYHYIVPELADDQDFHLSAHRLLAEIKEAQGLGHTVKVVLLGPLSYLWLAKAYGNQQDKLALLDRLVPVYIELFSQIAGLGVACLQVDEPILALDLAPAWQAAFERAYHKLQRRDLCIVLATYFAPLNENLYIASRLPVSGLHIDVVRSGQEWLQALDQLPDYKVLSLGLVDGRNIWRHDVHASLDILKPAYERLGERLWVASSCSLLHVPVDLEAEQQLSSEVKVCLAFAKQKLAEIACLKQALLQPDAVTVQRASQEARQAYQQLEQSTRWRNLAVQQRVAQLTAQDAQRASAFEQRALIQHQRLQLPLLPTTTIGSFPQTPEIRRARAAYKQGLLSESDYVIAMQQEIKQTLAIQEELGLDVLVHGEAERNDMVEYFGEQLQGYVFSQQGWVQSYGSRCVKPPIIVGDISRPQPMTVAWAQYAQQQSQRWVKGMLTGPVTMLCWSFARTDISREQIALQLALAIRDEVVDLAKAGIQIIQIDEPAFREGLPLRQQQQADYWRWAVLAFKLSAGGVSDDIQIHTHMCYSEFNDCIEAIAAMDADVITIETARSAMELLTAFEQFAYPNAIGPGVYDIHSPQVPTAAAMKKLLQKAAQGIDKQRLWVNPDCGLKTRAWPEVKQALTQMVQATQELRALWQ